MELRWGRSAMRFRTPSAAPPGDSTSTARCASSISRGGGAIRIETRRCDRSDRRPHRGQRRRWRHLLLAFRSTADRRQYCDCKAAACRPRALRCRQPRSGGADERARPTSRPIGVGGTRLALAPVRFAARPGRLDRGQYGCAARRPVSGGRVAGLQAPDLRPDSAAGGALRFGGRCLETSFASFQTAGFAAARRDAPAGLPDGGAIASQRPAATLPVGADLNRNLRLRGQHGPVAVRARLPRSVRLRRPSGSHAADLRGAMGRAESPVLINAARLEGNLVGRSRHIRRRQRDHRQGAAPAQRSSGDWRMRDGGVFDFRRHADLRIAPIRPISTRCAATTCASSWPTAGSAPTGSLHHPASGTKVSDVTIAAQSDTGDGNAVLDVPGITFGPGLQPEELTRLTEGVVALVRGG